MNENDVSESALLSKSEKKNKPRPSIAEQKKRSKCGYCKKPGHWWKECRKRLASKPEEKDESSALIGSTALMSARPANKDTWFLDSGASCHMTNDSSIFLSLKPIKEGEHSVTIGNLEKLWATGLGSVKVCSEINHNKRYFTLENVLLVPSLGFNLLSSPTLDRKGANIIHGNSAVKIIRDGNLIITGKLSESNLYALNIKSVPCSNDTAFLSSSNEMSTWHKRLGHLSIDTMKKASLTKELDIKDDKTDLFCKGCALGKSSVHSFPNDEKKRKEERGALVHADLCGPMQTASMVMRDTSC